MLNNNCYVCAKKSNNFLCSSCITNPFRIEDLRDILSRLPDLRSFKKTYYNNLPEIEDLNTANFWDNRLYKIQLLRTQDGMTKDRIKITADFLKTSGNKILDLGIGYGFIEEILSSKKIDFYGVDISPEAIRILKKRFKGHFSVGSIYKYKYTRNKFDAVVLLEVLEHVPPKKTFLILKNIHKVLKKNGIFIVSVPMNEELEKMKINKNGHVRTYTKNIIFAELKLAGFNVIEYKELYAFSKMYKFKKFLSKVMKHKWMPNNIIIKTIKI